jgi:hypothetical protein
MSTFIQEIHRLAAQGPKPDASTAADLLRGRVIAKEVIDAIHDGDQTPHLLVIAAGLAGQVGHVVICGFLEEIQDALQAPPRKQVPQPPVPVKGLP